MSDIGALVEELIAAGTPPALAASVVARAVLAGKDTAPYRDDLPDVRSKAAIRQQRYRDRNASVTKRNKNVTDHNADTVTPNVTERNESITERNENVTPLRAPIYLSSSSNNLDQKERKKERAPRQRYAPLPDNWAPSLKAYQLAEQCGQNVQLVEQIFRDYLKSSGKLYADYDAAFNNFIRNQQKFNRTGTNGTASAKSGSLLDAIDRELAKTELAQELDTALPADLILSIPQRSVR